MIRSQVKKMLKKIIEKWKNQSNLEDFKWLNKKVPKVGYLTKQVESVLGKPKKILKSKDKKTWVY